MKIAIGSDHGGYKLKEKVIAYLKGAGHRVKDFGCYDQESCDYPLFARSVARAVADGKAARGVLICTTGVGMAIAANKIAGVRAAVLPTEAIALSSREHNDCNVAVFGAKFMTPAKTRSILALWLTTRALGGRHRRRVRLIKQLEG
ncbi:MAG: ribose 5-phosphate isomerase B [Candidatus Omnitrophota bacterium]